VRLDRPSRETWVLVAIVVVGGLLRFAWLAYAARPLTFPAGGDPFGYVMHADDLAHGRGYVLFLTGRATAFQAPGWPFALAAWYWLANHTPLPDDVWNMAAGLNLLLGVASIVLVYAIGRRVFDARVGLIGAGVVALWPNLVYYTAVAALEPFFIFLVLLALWLLLRFGWPDAPRIPPLALVLVGFVVGWVLLVRPFGAVVIVAMVVAGVVAGRGWRRTLLEAGIVTLVAIAVLVPWTIRNAVRLHGFVPVATNLGETLCIGHQPDATGGLVGDTAYCVGRYDYAHITTPHLEIVRNRHAFDQGTKYALHHPVDEGRLLFWRGYFLFQDDHDGLDAVEPRGPQHSFIPRRPRLVLATVADAWFFAVAVLAAFSLPRWFGRRRGDRLLVITTALGLLLVPLELYGLPRFKVPLEPFLALGAAVTIARLTAREPEPAPAEVAS
jgi:4-amino-4-deoxy-L-arabinose transferase-like glycosyltransferase